MNSFGILAIAVWVYMSSWFAAAILKKRNDLADVAWGLGFVMVAWLGWILGGGKAEAILINLLVSIWGGRLAIHIYRRNKNKTEDYRYANWRKEWGKNFLLRSYLQVFLLQGVFLYLISLPVMAANQNGAGGMLGLGILVWLAGFYFEAMGDRQLKQFISEPKNKGKIMNEGLWRYSRHPNYFGEITMWWGLWLAGLMTNWWTIIGPITITVLIVFVSGVPLLEKKFEGRVDWEEYKRKTSMLIPLPPRK